MALTGRSTGPPLAAPGDVTGAVATALDRTAAAAAAREVSVDLPGTRILSERAAVMGLRRQGPRSCGGAFRTVETSDGWFGLSLARPDDIELLGALVEGDVSDDPWSTVVTWARTVPGQEAASRARMLGLPYAAWPPEPLESRPAVVTQTGGIRTPRSGTPLVIDLSALWAGPLCTHLLGLTGCRVVKVEDPRRPDGARRGSTAFFDLLHHGHDMISLDLDDSDDIKRLIDLMHRADLVIEASRPRALRQRGIVAADLVADGTSWLSICARGRSHDAVGFGDDIAVAAGLAIEDAGEVLPVGDAIADPLTGTRAAAEAAEALLDDRARLIDVSMIHTASDAAQGEPEPHEVVRRGTAWVVETAEGRWPVETPRMRRPRGPARPLGGDNHVWRSRW